MSFARAQFSLAEDVQGHALRDHLAAVARATGRKARLAISPSPPAGSTYIWHWWLDLHATRTSNGFGPNPLSYAEIDAWARLRGRTLTQFELDAIRAIDVAFLESYARNSRAEMERLRAEARK